MRIFFIYIYILLLAFSTTVHAQEKNKSLYSPALTEVYMPVLMQYKVQRSQTNR